MKNLKSFIKETEMQKAAREKIKREKNADKVKHDRMMDAARRRDTVTANQKEEVEQVDESYKRGQTFTRKEAEAYFRDAWGSKFNPRKMKKIDGYWIDYGDGPKRGTGSGEAVPASMKEEVEHLDELSPDTVKSYAKKAMKDAIGKKRKSDMYKSELPKNIKDREDAIDRIKKFRKEKGLEHKGQKAKRAFLSRNINLKKRAINKFDRDVENRKKGIKLANKKLARENFQQVDEGIFAKWKQKSKDKKYNAKNAAFQKRSQKRKQDSQTKANDAYAKVVGKERDGTLPNSSKVGDTVQKIAARSVLSKGRLKNLPRLPEEVEQVDEISKSTAMSYIKKAYASDRNMADKQTAAQGKQDYKTGDAISKKRNLRQKGINRATKKMFEGSAQDPDIKDREGTQPAAYHKGLKKSTKAKRDAHFKKHGKKADDDASAYQDAPGDKEARAKDMRKSRYTSFVDKMMDESVMHVNMHHIDGSKHEKGAVDVLKKHEKAGSISFDGNTDKGILFKVHKKHHVNTINRELKKHMTSLSEEDKGFAAKSKKSGISVNTLRKVYNRGVAAWKTGHRPGTTPQQWGHARVNAFITKKKKGGLNHDKDLA